MIEQEWILLEQIVTGVLEVQVDANPIHTSSQQFWSKVVYQQRTCTTPLQRHQNELQVTEDWKGKRYIGIDLDWNYKQRQVPFSMRGYVKKTLK